MMEISWKLYDWKFCWKLNAGKFFGNYMLGNSAKGVILAKCYVPCYEAQALHGTASDSRMRRAKRAKS